MARWRILRGSYRPEAVISAVENAADSTTGNFCRSRRSARKVFAQGTDNILSALFNIGVYTMIRLSAHYCYSIAGIITFLCACDSASAALPVQTSAQEAYKQSPIYWTSEDEIVFVGMEGKSKRNVYSWNISTSASQLLVENTTPILCYNRGQSLYSYATNPFLVSAVKFNRASEQKVDTEWLQSSLTCKPLPNDLHPVVAGNNSFLWLRQLLEEHGVLELPRDQRKDLIAYLHIPHREKPIPIPQINYENSYHLRQDGPRFYPDRGMYLITGRDEKNIRWLRPDGKVFEEPVPTGNWSSTLPNSAYIPVKQGTVVFDWESSGKGNTLLKGAYYVRGKASINFLVENFSIAMPAAVSPSGCRLAFSYFERSTNVSKIGVIDTCKFKP